jgi:putative peptidoglycan lipid II flippase
MMFGILLSRLLGFVRDRIISHQFGQGLETDIYNAAFTIPDLFFFLLAGGALSGAFIPVFTEYYTLGKKREAWRIFSAVAFVMTIAMSVLSLLGIIFAPQLVILTNPGYMPQMPQSFLPAIGWIITHTLQGDLVLSPKALQTVYLTRILLPAQICFMLGGLMMGTLNAQNKFQGQAYGPVIYNLGIIFGGLVLSRFFGIAGLCYGALGGAIIGNLLYQWVLVRRAGGRFVFNGLGKHLGHKGVKKVWKLMIPVIFGLSLPYVSTIIGRSLASDLGDGPQSALMNANRLMQMPLGVFAQSTAIAIFPTMSALAAEKNYAELRKTVCFGVRSILFLTIPCSLLMIVLALPIVQLLLQSGKFTTGDAELAAQVLCWFSIGIFAWSAHSVLTRGFYALQENYIPTIVGTMVTFIFIGLCFPFKKWLGVSGLALATSVAATIHMSAMLLLLRKRLKGLEGVVLLSSTLKIVGASLVTAGVCWVVRVSVNELCFQIPMPVFLRTLIVLSACLFVSVLTYGTFAAYLRMEEFKPVQKKMRGLVRKFSGRRGAVA